MRMRGAGPPRKDACERLRVGGWLAAARRGTKCQQPACHARCWRRASGGPPRTVAHSRNSDSSSGSHPLCTTTCLCWCRGAGSAAATSSRPPFPFPQPPVAPPPSPLPRLPQAHRAALHTTTVATPAPACACTPRHDAPHTHARTRGSAARPRQGPPRRRRRPWRPSSSASWLPPGGLPSCASPPRCAAAHRPQPRPWQNACEGLLTHGAGGRGMAGGG